MTRAEELMMEIEAENKEREKKRAAERIQEEQHEKALAEECRELISGYGGRMMWTNGYVYKFSCGGMEITLCDQKDRAVGTMHRALSETEEDFLKWSSHKMGEELKKEFRYKDICTSDSVPHVLKGILDVLLTHRTKTVEG